MFNNILNKLPVELHILGYNYCGPGTKLDERLSRGDKLDEACQFHDIHLIDHKDTSERHTLENKAWERVVSKDAGIGERSGAYFTNAMEIERYLGMGLDTEINIFQ